VIAVEQPVAARLSVAGHFRSHASGRRPAELTAHRLFGTVDLPSSRRMISACAFFIWLCAMRRYGEIHPFSFAISTREGPQPASNNVFCARKADRRIEE
jgi:hypothetical protein